MYCNREDSLLEKSTEVITVLSENAVMEILKMRAKIVGYEVWKAEVHPCNST